MIRLLHWIACMSLVSVARIRNLNVACVLLCRGQKRFPFPFRKVQCPVIPITGKISSSRGRCTFVWIIPASFRLPGCSSFSVSHSEGVDWRAKRPLQVNTPLISLGFNVQITSSPSNHHSYLT
jgi:hypothetical protein